MTESPQIFHIDVFITLKRLVNDPEGIEIQHGLHNLGYEGVEEVRSGKYLQLRVRAENESEAMSQVAEMCDRLLSNTVIEDYRVEISRVAAVTD